MPITAVHFSIGALAKAIAPKKFSFQVFLLSQIMMDVQPGVNLMLGWRPLHGWTHTYWGGVFVGLCVVLLWRLWEWIRPKPFGSYPINNKILLTSSLFGTLSHVWLDSQYHQDMSSLVQDFGRFLAPSQVEGFCLVTLSLAGIIFSARFLLARLSALKGRMGPSDKI